MTRYFWLLVPLFLTACNSGDDSIPENSTPIEVSSITNFNEGDDNWVASFSDYPVDDKDIFQLESGINEIPNSNGQRGFLLGGMNRSDDLFMFLKKQVVDLVPNTRYLLTVDVNFWSEAGNVCFGIGGSPGDSVYMKVGASEIEPAQADYYMNIDIGHQSSDGSDALVVGNVSVDGLSCEGGEFAMKQVSLMSDAKFEVVSSPYGYVWVFVGSDSGYEGLTRLYYESVSITLTPVL